LNSPVFRPIGAPLDVPDTALDTLNRQLGVPTLVPPVTRDAPPAEPRSLTKAINIHVPDYAVAALKAKAFEADSSVRFIVLKALDQFGIAIRPADLVEDARRSDRTEP